MTDAFTEKSPAPRQTQCENCANAEAHLDDPCPRRVQIAAAARAVIVEKGLEGLRTRDIAARAGINIATMHYHVPTKEALISLVAESTRRDFVARLAGRPQPPMTPRQWLRFKIDDHLELMRSQPELLIVMSEFAERSRRDPVVRRIYAQMWQNWVAKIEEIFVSGVADGSFRPDLDPKAGAQLFANALRAGVWNSLGDMPTSETFFSELERCFLRAHPNEQEHINV